MQPWYLQVNGHLQRRPLLALMSLEPRVKDIFLFHHYIPRLEIPWETTVVYHLTGLLMSSLNTCVSLRVHSSGGIILFHAGGFSLFK